MNGLLAVLQNFAQSITGPFGIAAISVAIGGTAIAAAWHFLAWRHVWHTFIAGAVAFSAAAVVTMLHG